MKIEGDGPLVVLSHALALDHSMWDGVAARLSTQYTVARHDHRGHGGSQLGDGGPGWSIEDLADDVAAQIRALDRGPVVFVGLSLGGMVGQALAARHARLLRALALLNTTAHYPDRSGWDARVRTVQEQGMEAVVEASLERWLSPVFQATSEGQAAARVLRERLLSMDNQAYRHTCAAIAAMDLRHGNRSLSLPTLVIAGRQDLATPPAMSRALVADIAGARLVEVEAAHLSAVECPDRVAGVLHDWLRALPSI